MEEVNNIETTLKARGIKPTSNRVLVIRALADAHGPMSLAELEAKIDTLEKSSIFRVLGLFLAHHLVHAVEDGRGIVKYEICNSHNHDEGAGDDDLHPHFYCTACQQTFCIHTAEIPQVTLPEGFKPASTNYMIKGLCPDCAKMQNQ